MIECAVLRRPAQYKGEVGLFGVDQHSDETIKSVGSNQAWAKITLPRNLKQQRFLWALCAKLVDGGLYEDKDEAMKAIKMRVGWCDKVAKLNANLEPYVTEEPRSLSGADADALGRLINRVVWVVCAELLSHIKEEDLRREIEEMM